MQEQALRETKRIFLRDFETPRLRQLESIAEFQPSTLQPSTKLPNTSIHLDTVATFRAPDEDTQGPKTPRVKLTTNESPNRNCKARSPLRIPSGYSYVAVLAQHRPSARLSRQSPHPRHTSPCYGPSPLAPRGAPLSPIGDGQCGLIKQPVRNQLATLCDTARSAMATQHLPTYDSNLVDRHSDDSGQTKFYQLNFGGTKLVFTPVFVCPPDTGQTSAQPVPLCPTLSMDTSLLAAASGYGHGAACFLTALFNRTGCPHSSAGSFQHSRTVRRPQWQRSAAVDPGDCREKTGFFAKVFVPDYWKLFLLPFPCEFPSF